MGCSSSSRVAEPQRGSSPPGERRCATDVPTEPTESESDKQSDSGSMSRKVAFTEPDVARRDSNEPQGVSRSHGVDGSGCERRLSPERSAWPSIKQAPKVSRSEFAGAFKDDPVRPASFKHQRPKRMGGDGAGGRVSVHGGSLPPQPRSILRSKSISVPA
jgi:hypothetical protein